MNTDSQQILDEYLTWLREHSEVRRVADWGEITVPFLDRHNDHLQLYVKRSNGDVVFTDDGYTVADLEQSGCSLASPKRRGLLDVTLNGFGVKMDGDALVVRASSGDAARKMHNLVQAMLAVDDLFYLAEPVVTSLFLEDVAEWLTETGVRFTPDVKFTGKSGYDYRFDFVIPRSSVRPERVLRAVNHPTNDAARTLAFAWIDTLQARRADSVAFAFLNDGEQPVGSSMLEALGAWDIRPVVWSKRASVADELAAQSSGKTIRIFLADGESTGLLVAEIRNWTGKVLVAVRSQLDQLGTREEVRRSGGNLLVGPDPDDPSRQLVYVGESNNRA